MAHDDILTSRLKAFRERAANTTFLASDRVMQQLLPDFCQIRPSSDDNMTISSKGLPIFDTPAFRTFRSSELIPCRADVARAFRPDRFAESEGTVDELDIHLPHNMPVEESDYVLFDGAWFAIRKLDESSAMDLTKVAKVMRIGVAMDYPEVITPEGNAYSEAYSEAYG
jgi:hypothetical protein